VWEKTLGRLRGITCITCSSLLSLGPESYHLNLRLAIPTFTGLLIDISVNLHVYPNERQESRSGCVAIHLRRWRTNWILIITT
jgi:hypothetical protein